MPTIGGLRGRGRCRSRRDLKMRKLFVVLKVASSCNLNCTYCNIFNGADKTIYKQKKTLAPHIASALGEFLWTAVSDGEVDSVHVVLHGGEPLLLKPIRLGKIISSITKEFGDQRRLSFSLQTNGTLLSSSWLDFFEEHKLHIGISVDGNEEAHNSFRIYKDGSGSFTDVEAGIRLTQAAVNDGRVPSLGLLAVWNPLLRADELYNQYVRRLGIRSVDVLLPDATHDIPPSPVLVKKLSSFLTDLYDAWYLDETASGMVRIVGSVFSMLVGGKTLLSSFGETGSYAITVEADGSLRLDDHLRSCGNGFTETGLSVLKHTFKDFTDHPLVTWVTASSADLPYECSECVWKRLCRGGELIHRYGQESFSHPSIYCDALKSLFSRATESLIRDGYDLGNLSNALLIPE